MARVLPRCTASIWDDRPRQCYSERCSRLRRVGLPPSLRCCATTVSCAIRRWAVLVAFVHGDALGAYRASTRGTPSLPPLLPPPQCCLPVAHPVANVLGLSLWWAIPLRSRRRPCSARPSLTGVFRARCGLPLPIASCWRCRRCDGPPSSSAPLGVPLAPPSYSFLLRFRAPAVSPPLLSPLRVSGRAAGRPQSSRGLVGVLVFAAFVACASWCSRFQSASTVSQLLGFV